MIVRATFLLTLALLMASPASARQKALWQATRTTGPITGKSSCVVAAYDRAAGMAFTRVGGLYPIIEMNADHGLLVGVSSGGRVRLPTGDILWRVDDLPHHELKAADNPAGQASAIPADVIAKASQDAVRMAQAMMATSTVASGDLAWAMLAELRAGHGLQFRQVAAASPTAYPAPLSTRPGR